MAVERGIHRSQTARQGARGHACDRGDDCDLGGLRFHAVAHALGVADLRTARILCLPARSTVGGDPKPNPDSELRAVRIAD